METPLVSIIMLNYNGGAFLIESIESILKTNYPNFEFLLIDNASKDDSLLKVKTRFEDPRLRIIENEQNLQYARGNNLASMEAKGEYIALVNNDVSATPDWLTPLVNCIISDPKVGACQSKLLQYNNRWLFDSAGGFMTANGVGGNRGFNDVDRGQYDKCELIFVAKGAAMLIRKDLFKRIGGFDPFYVAIYEDVDLSWRINLSGFKICYIPQSVVYHVGRASSKKNPSKETFLSVRNSLLTLIKNYNLRNMLKFIVPSIIIRLFSIPMQFVSLAGTKSAEDHPVLNSSPLDVIKAFASLIVNLGSILNSRIIVQRYLRQVNDQEALSQMWRIDGEIGQIVRWSLFYRGNFSYSSFLERYKR
jgi:GT2 family glycosyltransferase